MTLPYERLNAVSRTRKFLYDLIDPAVTPRVPKHIRQQALHLLKHYPHDFEMDMVCDYNSLGKDYQPIFTKK